MIDRQKLREINQGVFDTTIAAFRKGTAFEPADIPNLLTTGLLLWTDKLKIVKLNEIGPFAVDFIVQFLTSVFMSASIPMHVIFREFIGKLMAMNEECVIDIMLEYAIKEKARMNQEEKKGENP